MSQDADRDALAEEAARAAAAIVEEADRAAKVLEEQAGETAQALTEEAARVAASLRAHRRATVVWSTVCAGIVALVMAYFISGEVNKGLETQQTQLRTELIDTCVRGGIARNDRYTYAIEEEGNATYQASQANDVEVEKGWNDKVAYERQRQKDIVAEAERIGNRLPGSVMNDCPKVVTK